MSPDTFLCSFSSPEARDRVLLECPWMVARQLIIVEKWRPSFHVGSEATFLTPVWICLPFLPLAFWDPENLAHIAQYVEDLICIDGIIVVMDMFKFARICVRVDLSKKLLLHTRIRSPVGEFEQPIFYEGLQAMCFRCGSTKRRISDCPLGKSFAQLLSESPETVPPPFRPHPRYSRHSLSSHHS